MLAGMKPKDELAYRLALRGHFPRARARESWNARIDALMTKLVKNDPDTLVRFLKRSADLAEQMRARFISPTPAPSDSSRG
jgi:hypothetical protein